MKLPMFKDANEVIKLGHCYEIAGHRPIVIVRYDITFGKGRGLLGREAGYIYVEGYTPARYKQYEKFMIIPDDGIANKDFRTVGEIEGLTAPPLTSFRFRHGSKVKEVELSI